MTPGGPGGSGWPIPSSVRYHALALSLRVGGGTILPTRRVQVTVRLRSLPCRTCRLPWVTTWILEMIVCQCLPPGRDGKEAAEQLKAIYPRLEAKNAELDITAPSSKLGELALQHRGTGSSSSAQHPKPNAVVESSSSSDPPSSRPGDDVESS